jgi:DNA mismatch repair protein MutL
MKSSVRHEADLKSEVFNETSRPEFQEPAKEENFENQYHWSKLQVLGQADNCYIVAQSRQSLIMIDQHAAHERIAFERILHAWEGEGMDIQDYLLPLTFKMEEEEVEAVLEVKDDLLKLGLTVERSGPDELAVSSAPSFLKEKAIPLAFEKLAREVIQNGAGTAVERKLKDIAATMACHSVVRAGQALSIEEMQALLVQMDEHPLSSFCPHGRPVFVEYPFTKIDKDFGRIV